MKAKSNNYRGKVDISVSQNFITSKNTIYKLIKKTNISKNDFVIEIGPGKGHITEALCEKSYWVTAIELDRSLYGNLINKFKSKNNVTLINKDFLNWKLHYLYLFSFLPPLWYECFSLLGACKILLI